MSGIYFAAIDIGGTKTSVGLFDEKLNLLKKDSFTTNSQDGCTALIKQANDVLHFLCDQADVPYNLIKSVGIASPGPIDLKTGTVLHIPTMGWQNEPILDISLRVFQKKVFLQNDTNAAALGEYVFGQGIGHDCVVYITISTGISCGIVINGEIYNGSHSAAGEIGHINLIRNARQCGCGNKGCLEAYASGKSIATIACEKTGCNITTKKVFDEARAGNKCLIDIISFAGESVGYAVSLIYQILDPAIVIIGGSVTKDFDILYPIIKDAVELLVEPCAGRKINIVKSGFDGEQILLGMAYIAKNKCN
jgi:glucokinase